MGRQSTDHWIDLVSQQDKIPRDRSLALARWLEVDGGGNSHSRWNLHFPFADLLYPGNGELQDPSVDFPGVTEGLLDLPGVKINGLLCSRWRCGCGRRGFCQINCSGKLTR